MDCEVEKTEIYVMMRRNLGVECLGGAQIQSVFGHMGKSTRQWFSFNTIVNEAWRHGYLRYPLHASRASIPFRFNSLKIKRPENGLKRIHPLNSYDGSFKPSVAGCSKYMARMLHRNYAHLRGGTTHLTGNS